VGVHDLTAPNAELLQTVTPAVQLGAVLGTESDVVQARAPRVEGGRLVDLFGELMQPEKGLAQREDHVPERAGVFIEDGVDADYLAVPRNAHRQVAHRERDMCDRANSGSRLE
jgi:hypothetical protein